MTSLQSTSSRNTSLHTTAPARLVVERASAYNRQHGHEIDGFLSLDQGFLPEHAPLLKLPESHAVWDDMIPRLPELHTTLTLRSEFDRLPVLRADADALPDAYLWRASTVLGVFAHSYFYVHTDPPDKLPDCLLQPWAEVARRLGRPMPYLSYGDLFMYNWRYKSEQAVHDTPRTLENMELLVPTWNNDSERVFYLITVEVAAHFTPILSAVIEAQEAVLRDDAAALESALLLILDRLNHITQVVYPRIDPNPFSATHVDQVVWAKTVATFGVAVLPGAPSPSGTAHPHIHMLDAFLERQSYGSLVGKQSVYLGGHSPRHWQELPEAVRQISVRSYVERKEDRALSGLYNAVLDAYAGDKGFLGLHRIKAYGFLEVAFKVGRSVTTGARFTGLFKDRTWDKIDGELAQTQHERYPDGNRHVYIVTPHSGTISTDPHSGEWINFVQLNTSGQGIHYRPGDRVGILPENSAELVERTLAALHATGDEVITLTTQWQQAIRLRAAYAAQADVKALPLRVVLTYGQIRPLMRDAAKRLLKASASEFLKGVIDARMENQWELWDVLRKLHEHGFDVSCLWKAAPWEAQTICRIVPPEVFRLYSIAGSQHGDGTTPNTTLKLIVSGLDYESPQTEYSRQEKRAGTSSHFLRRAVSSPAPISLQIVPTSRFRPPRDPSRPIVMFAAGSGVAPFIGFLEERSKHPTQNWLFFGTRTADQFHNREQFERWCSAGVLTLHMAFSHAPLALRVEAGRFTLEPGTPQRVDELIRAHADALWELLLSESDGGKGAYFYVCGRTGFAHTVLETLREVIRTRTHNADSARTFMYRLVAEGRYVQDIFTTYSGSTHADPIVSISDLILRNTPENGYWTVINGRVYDMTEFMNQHVGGSRIIANSAGTDATGAYQMVQHHVNSEVGAQRDLYKIGTIQRLHFGSAWGVVLTKDGLAPMLLEDAFKVWMRYTYVVVGMENALENDFSFANTVSVEGEAAQTLTPFKMQFLLEAHRRFLVSYLDGLLHDDLPPLWEIVVGFFDPKQDVRLLQTALARMMAMPEYRFVRVSIRYVKWLLFTAQDSHDERADRLLLCAAICRAVMHADKQLLFDIKMLLREGIIAFEKHQSAVLTHDQGLFIQLVKNIPERVAAYYTDLAEALVQLGIHSIPDDMGEEPISEDTNTPGHGGEVIVKTEH
jgi:sulfite reductase alpha subunit-like flavoprotein